MERSVRCQRFGDVIAALVRSEAAEVQAFDACSFAELAALHAATPIVREGTFREFVQAECEDEGPPFDATRTCREILAR